MECQSCKEVNVEVVNTYLAEGQIVDTIVDELICPDCGAYSQMVSLSDEYDPTPDEQGEPPVTKNTKWKDNKVEPR